MASSAAADTISTDIQNAAFAPVTILESHPQCDGFGAVAFRFNFEQNDLVFQLNVDEDTTFFQQNVIDGVAPVRQICTRRERRGTEVVRLHIDCDDAQTTVASPFAFLAPDDVTLALSGHFTACQSPTSFDMLESAWTATVTQRGSPKEYSNSFATYPKEGCEATEIDTDPSAKLTYSISGASDPLGNWRGRYRLWGSPKLTQQTPAFFEIELRNIPLESITQTDSRLVSNASAIFFPTYEGKSECVDGLCELPRILGSVRGIDRPVRVCR